VEVRLFAQLQLCRTFGVLVRICLSSSPSNPIDIFFNNKVIHSGPKHARKQGATPRKKAQIWISALRNLEGCGQAARFNGKWQNIAFDVCSKMIQQN
jgi:hypothetical protein